MEYERIEKIQVPLSLSQKHSSSCSFELSSESSVLLTISLEILTSFSIFDFASTFELCRAIYGCFRDFRIESTKSICRVVSLVCRLKSGTA